MALKLVPIQGMPAWHSPDPNLEPSFNLDPYLEVELVEVLANGWARIRASNGWEGWVDGELLIDAADQAAVPISDSPPPKSRKVLIIAVAAVVLIAVSGGGFLFLRNRSSQASQSVVDDLSDAKPTAIEVSSALAGSPDRQAAADIKKALADAGIAEIPGFEIFIFPIAGTKESLLVFDVQDVGQEAESSNSDQFSKTVFAHPALARANVKQFAINIRGSDEQGPFVATLTAPLDLSLMQQASASGADLLQEGNGIGKYKFQLKRSA